MVRQATVEDVDAVIRLVPDLVAFGPPPWRDREQMTQTDSAVIRAAMLDLDRRDDGVVFVAALGIEVVGFIHVRGVVEYYSQKAQGHVADLVVAKDAQGFGIGSRLLRQAEDWASIRGFAFLTIAVFERNDDALKLYERRGFQREIVRLIKPLDSRDD